jgi:hypothetical protein
MQAMRAKVSMLRNDSEGLQRQVNELKEGKDAQFAQLSRKLKRAQVCVRECT